jgi:glycosyltransferase involved in cell wall biosynthesis
MRIIFTFHTQPHTQSFLTGKPAKERGLIRLTIFNRLLRYCDATTYVSRSLMNSLEKTGIKIVKPVVIPNGVIEKKVSSEDIINFKQKYNLIDDYPVLCMIASLAWDSKVKGIEILIQAFKKVLSFQLRSKLLIVGDGQYRKYLEDYVEKENLEKKVIFTGNMDNPFIALSACDIYCHISLNEACPIAPLEAMIAGKPIIASNDAGLPEIITDDFNGILVDSNPNSIAKAILSLVENPNLVRKLSENAIISAKTKFSWEKITREYIKLYKNE